MQLDGRYVINSYGSLFTTHSLVCRPLLLASNGLAMVLSVLSTGLDTGSSEGLKTLCNYFQRLVLEL